MNRHDTLPIPRVDTLAALARRPGPPSEPTEVSDSLEHAVDSLSLRFAEMQFESALAALKAAEDAFRGEPHEDRVRDLAHLALRRLQITEIAAAIARTRQAHVRLECTGADERHLAPDLPGAEAPSSRVFAVRDRARGSMQATDGRGDVPLPQAPWVAIMIERQ